MPEPKDKFFKRYPALLGGLIITAALVVVQFIGRAAVYYAQPTIAHGWRQFIDYEFIGVVAIIVAIAVGIIFYGAYCLAAGIGEEINRK